MKRCQANRDGAIFLVLMLLLPIVVLFVGFTVDVAYVQRVRAELRATTDLAAKSGAIRLSLSHDLNQARQEAIDIAALNGVGGIPLTLEANQLEFGTAMRQADGTYSYITGGSYKNSLKVHGKRTIDSADGGVHSFFGYFYGHPTYQPQFESTAAFIDIDICLALDRSGSMKSPVVAGGGSNPTNEPPHEDSRWVALDGSVRQFLTIMNTSTAQEKISLVTFADNASIDQPLDFDYSNVESDMDDYLEGSWSGMTNVHDAINKGRSTLTGSNSRSHAMKVMVLFTDGQYNSGGDPRPEATMAAQDDIVIHTITFSDGADQATMQAVANTCGGSHYHADDASDLDSIFRQIAASVSALVD